MKKGLELRLPLSEMACYTDSKVVLHWIRGADKEWKQFVQNCTTEIRTLLPEATYVDALHGKGQSSQLALQRNVSHSTGYQRSMEKRPRPVDEWRAEHVPRRGTYAGGVHTGVKGQG